ncbi:MULTISPECIES: TIGR04438 family Trp-rich protein [unclassified Methylibium]|uniref:TIGR04438 family Trp-rich protein n=1 Tax=unclassified Methylibium TaxID=2633235 RepID=UPI0009EBC705
MWFVVLGVLLSALKLLDIGAVGVWSWWVVLAPFALAVIWWTWADMSGYTKRKEMEKMDERKVARRNKSMAALGIDPRAFEKKKAAAFKASHAKRTDKIEGQREAERKKARDSVLNSRFDNSQSTSRIDGAPDTKR